MSDANERNVISGNGLSGVTVTGTTTTGTIIAGNYIGLNASGAAAVGNSQRGVNVFGGAKNTRIGTNGDGTNDSSERNIISGNTMEGVLVQNTTTSGTVIAGNYIGTSAAGTTRIGNSSGVSVNAGATNTRIGTDGSNDAFNDNERNVISGNNAMGVFIGDTNTTGVSIAGNYIGITPDGLTALRNNDSGVYLFNTVATRVGTNADGVRDDAERNIISGNTIHGIFVTGSSANNKIGRAHV